jgi:hypothetical protein
LALILVGGGSAVRAAPSADGVGRPLIHNYNRRDFGAEVQQWDVIQDARGIMYFANNAGVLEFDGRNWRLIELPSRLGVRALAVDPTGTGRIYVGAGGDFGYLSPDAAGQLQFTSLMPPEAKQDRGFDQVFTPVSAPDGRVYFQARTKLCRWFNGRIGCRDVAGTLSRIFAAGRKLYVQTTPCAPCPGESGSPRRMSGSCCLTPLTTPAASLSDCVRGSCSFSATVRSSPSHRPSATAASKSDSSMPRCCRTAHLPSARACAAC